MCDDSGRGAKKGEQMTKVTLEALKKGGANDYDNAR